MNRNGKVPIDLLRNPLRIQTGGVTPDRSPATICSSKSMLEKSAQRFPEIPPTLKSHFHRVAHSFPKIGSIKAANIRTIANNETNGLPEHSVEEIRSISLVCL